MTPEAVIDRYLATAIQDPLDTAAFAEVLGADADLLRRWLQLLGCPAEPGAVHDALAALPPEHFRDLVVSQALAVLSIAGSVRLSFEQWYGVLRCGALGRELAAELELEDPQAVGWRMLLACSGLNLPHDPLLSEMLAFRGARRDMLQDASAIHRLLAVVECLNASDAAAAPEAARMLLGLEPGQFEAVLLRADESCRQLLEKLRLPAHGELDADERVWLRLQLDLLGRLFDGTGGAGDAAFLEMHRMICRRLFRSTPALLLVQEGALGAVGERDWPRIAVDSDTSVIARSVRLGERSELFDGPDLPVADRQVLRRLGGSEALCLPLGRGERVQGVLLAVADDDHDHEPALKLYAEELARHLEATEPASPGRDALSGYRQREEKRLRELVHEANNPLSIVNNYLHILQLKLAHEPEAVEQLQLIGAELRRAGEIIGRVRELPELVEREEAVVEAAELDLNALIHRQVELHAGYAHEREVSLEEVLVPGTLTITSDEQRLAQILANLMKNAVEAAPHATVTVRSLSGVFREGRAGVVLEVSDTGPGLPREVLERLAEPKQSGKGGDHAGLGLHIVHRLVAELGASLDVRTSPELGTTFAVFLPEKAAA